MAVLLVARLLGTIIGRWLRHVIKKKLHGGSLKYQYIENSLNRLLDLTPLIFSLIILWLCIQVVIQIEYHTYLMVLVLNLSIAWVIIQLATSIILDRFWSRIIASQSSSSRGSAGYHETFKIRLHHQ